VSSRGWRVYFGLGACGIGVYFAVSSVAVQDVLYSAIGASTLVALVVGLRAHRPRARGAWHLLLAGQACFVAGDLVFDVLADVLHKQPFPSAADGLYLIGYPLFAAGLVGFVRARTPGRDRASLIDALIIGSAVAVVAWVFWIDRYADTSLGDLEMLVSVAYPVMDIILIAVLARLAVSPGERASSYRLLWASLVSLLLADILYTGLELTLSYHGRNPIDALWLISYLALGAAALHPSMRTLTERSPGQARRFTRRRLALLAASSLTAPVVFGIQTLRGRPVDGPVVVFGSAVMFLLVVARMEGLIRQVESNVGQLEAQREALGEALAKEQQAVVELRELSRKKGDFVAMVSHELRTPLTTIIGFAKTLQQRPIADDPTLRDESVGAIERQGDRLLRLVENLLTASRLENEGLRLRVETVVFGEVCSEVVEGLLSGAERIRLIIPADLPRLLTDRSLLGRVLANLVDNALKYSAEDSPCEVGARRLGHRIEFWVRDRGIGIPSDELGRIFDRFYQIDSPKTVGHSGVGLGLSLVKDLVRDLGGSLAVASRTGEGSTFTVRIPIRHPVAGDEAEGEASDYPSAVASSFGH
jgi:signal transduction histidine kinase